MERIGKLIWCLLGLSLALGRSGPAAAEQKCVGWIAVDTGEVQGAEIHVDGEPVGLRSPDTVKGVACGQHTVTVHKELYRAQPRKVQVASGDVAKVQLELVPNFASLEVLSKPGGAEVWLDGEKAGKTPLKLARTEAGRHRLEVRLADYATAERKVVLRPGGESVQRFTLKPDFGSLVVEAPEGAEATVWLDGDALGPAPVELKRVVAGRHTVRVTAELYRPFERKVMVRPGRPTRIRARLRPNHGTLAIQTRPPGGRVRIDSEVAGVTPLEVKLAPGQHAVEVRGPSPAYTPVARKVRVRRGGRHKLVLKLPAKTGMLMIDTVPFGARIEIDGKPRGTGPLSLKAVPVGAHVLVARKKGLPPLHGRIEVVEGERSVVEMNLKEPERSVYRSPAAPAVVAESKTKTKAKPESEPEPQPAPAAEPEPQPEAEPEPEPGDDSTEVAEAEAETPVFVDDGSGEEADTEVSAQAAAGMSAQRWSAWITGGTAVAAVVACATMFGMGFATEADADDAYQKWLDNRDTPQADQLEDEYKELDRDSALYKNVGWGMLGGAVALGAVSVVLFLTEPEPEVDATGPQDGFGLAPLPGGAMASYRIRF
jgi:hypothetical protein